MGAVNSSLMPKGVEHKTGLPETPLTRILPYRHDVRDGRIWQDPADTIERPSQRGPLGRWFFSVKRPFRSGPMPEGVDWFDCICSKLLNQACLERQIFETQSVVEGHTKLTILAFRVGCFVAALRCCWLYQRNSVSRKLGNPFPPSHGKRTSRS